MAQSVVPPPHGPVRAAGRILPQRRLHLRPDAASAAAGLALAAAPAGLDPCVGLLHEAVLVELVDVEAAEARGERAPRHGGRAESPLLPPAPH